MKIQNVNISAFTHITSASRFVCVITPAQSSHSNITDLGVHSETNQEP